MTSKYLALTLFVAVFCVINLDLCRAHRNDYDDYEDDRDYGRPSRRRSEGYGRPSRGRYGDYGRQSSRHRDYDDDEEESMRGQGGGRRSRGSRGYEREDDGYNRGEKGYKSPKKSSKNGEKSGRGKGGKKDIKNFSIFSTSADQDLKRARNRGKPKKKDDKPWKPHFMGADDSGGSDPFGDIDV